MGYVRFSFVDGSVELVRVGSPRHRELTAAGHTPDGTVPPADGISDALEQYLATLLGGVTNPQAADVVGLADTIRSTLVATLTEGDGTTLTWDPTARTLTVASEGGGVGTVAIDDVTGLTAALAGKSATGHKHAAADLTATGTRDSSTVLHGDNVWRAVEAGGGVVELDYSNAAPGTRFTLLYDGSTGFVDPATGAVATGRPSPRSVIYFDLIGGDGTVADPAWMIDGDAREVTA